MKLITLFFGLLLSTSAVQKKHKIDFVGTWKVTEVNIDKNSPVAANTAVVSMMRSSMSRVVFIFQANHHVAMGGATPQQQVPDGMWYYNSDKKQLDIKSGNGDDKRTVSMIVTNNDKGEVYFKMLNAPITLKVTKV